MRNLYNILCEVCKGKSRSRGVYRLDVRARSASKKYLEIPIFEDEFEIPVFALGHLNFLKSNHKTVDKIIIELTNLDYASNYVTFDRVIQQLFVQDFERYKLIQFKVKQKENKITYYVTHGAVFDAGYKPVIIITWKLKKVQIDQVNKYRFVEPIIHISPECFISQSDPMQRWCSKKLPTAGLSGRVYTPAYEVNAEVFDYDLSNPCRNIKIEIAKIPFTFKSIDVPSISTTNEELLQIAMNHIDNVTQ